MTSAKVDVKIKEIKTPEVNAQLIAENVTKQLASRIPFRRAMKKAIGEAKKHGVGGIKISVLGKIGRR